MHEGADEDAPRLLAHHRVPQRARVAIPAHGVPRQRRRVDRRRRTPGRDQLLEGGDLTRGRVDEERAHAHPGYGGGLRALAGGAAHVRRRPAAPRRRRAHTPGLRHRRGRAGGLGDRERAQPAARSTTRSLRRWAARLSQRGAAPRTMARKLASIRSLFRSLLEHGEIELQPGRPAARAASSRRRCPRRSSRHDIAAAAGARSRPRRRSSSATARCSSSPTAAGCAPRSSSTSTSPSIDFDAEQVRVEGKGVQDPLRARRRARRCARSPPIWSVPGRRCQRRRRPRAVSCPRAANGCRRPTSGAACGCGRGTLRRRPACTRTRSVIPSQRTCSRAARTCARSRRCSVTPASRRPRSTLG